MQIGACYKTSLLADGIHPAKLCIEAQRLAGFRACAAAMVQFKPLELESAYPLRPSGHTAALLERFVCGKDRTKRQEAQPFMTVVVGWDPSFKTLGIAELFSQHLHPAADPEDVSTVGGIGAKRVSQSTVVEGGKVAEGLFAAWDDNGIGLP